MKTSTIVTALLGSLLATACATDADSGVDVDVTAAPSDTGKFDAIAGKQFRFHHVESWQSAQKDGAFPDLLVDQSMKINVATDTTAVVSGKAWGFNESNWPEDTILKLSATPRTGAKVAPSMLLVMIDSFTMKAITCSGANLFASVALDPFAKEVHVDGKQTFTYAQCGLESARPSIDIFVVPTSTTGSLEGEYKFRLNATVE